MRKITFIAFITIFVTWLICFEPVIAPVQVALASPVGPTGFWATIRAYKVDEAFRTGIEPHYGAFFQGAWGRNQHYLGPGGDDATCSSSKGCIRYWDWWGPWSAVLLLPKKGWLWCQACCPYDPNCVARWRPENYLATLWIN